MHSKPDPHSSLYFPPEGGGGGRVAFESPRGAHTQNAMGI